MDESKVIEISNANIFQEDNLILSDVNLSLAQGESVGLAAEKPA